MECERKASSISASSDRPEDRNETVNIIDPLRRSEEEENVLFDQQHSVQWEGIVWKQGQFIKSWRKRYMLLKGTRLIYYASKEKAVENKTKYKGQVTVVGAEMDHHRSYGFKVRTNNNKNFYAYTESFIETKMWVELINRAVSQENELSKGLETNSSEDIVKSCVDLQMRNMTVVRNFYRQWCNLMKMSPDEFNPSDLLNIFNYLSPDALVYVDYPVHTKSGGCFYGREGLLHHILAQNNIMDCQQFTMLRVVSASKPNIVQVLGHAEFYSRFNETAYPCSWKHQITLSPAGKFLNFTMHFDLDDEALKTAISGKSESKCMQEEHCTRSKRLLSLSIHEFELKRILGKGSFGTVVMAKKKGTKNLFAIKILRKEQLSKYDCIRTRTEMEIMRDIHHPFVASLRFSFQSPSKLYLGMTYFPGGSLQQQIFQRNTKSYDTFPMTESRVKLYAAQIILALAHLHSCGVIYRDLKPGNIMIDKRGDLVLVDFGLCKTQVHSNTTKTMAGSPAYTAPELLKSNESRAYGHSVDYWCLGVILYELFLGIRPFVDENVATLYKKIIEDQVIFPADVELSSDARSLVLGLLQKDPTNRLGYRHVNQLTNHSFFTGMNWEHVLKKEMVPEWIPSDDKSHESMTTESQSLTRHEIDDLIYSPRSTGSKRSARGSGAVTILGGRTPSKAPLRTQGTLSTPTDHVDKDFLRFSFVHDGPSPGRFLVDEDDILDTILKGKQSKQFQDFSMAV